MKTADFWMAWRLLWVLTFTGCSQGVSPVDPAATQAARLKRVLLYSGEQMVSIVREYDYDAQKRLIRVSVPRYDQGAKVGMTLYDDYAYDESGRVSAISNYNANMYEPSGFSLLKVTRISYNKENQKVQEWTDFLLAGNSNHVNYRYEGKKLVRCDKFERPDQLSGYVVYAYNPSGEMISETTHSANDVVTGVVTHVYQNGLNPYSEEYSGNREHKLREITRQFDEKGNIIQLTSNELQPYSSMKSYVWKYEYLPD
ncbi:MAG: hypothetical protein LWW85_00960 [Marinilabiliales bacterium]|nr:hypothetical protein [Marinilabiliales bacterium]